MQKLEKLYDNVIDKQITVVNSNFSNSKKSCCMNMQGNKTILIDRDKIETKAEEYIVLAEEISHLETGNMYPITSLVNSSIQKANREKAERMAKTYMIENFLPLYKIIKCIKNYILDINEMAEYLEVTPEFVLSAIEHYKSNKSAIFYFNKLNGGDENGFY